jgi:hypothetical protein
MTRWLRPITRALMCVPLTLSLLGMLTVSAASGQDVSGNDLATVVGDPTLGGSLACRAADLYASVQWEAGLGNRYGVVTVTNSSGGPCILPAYPNIQIEDGQGNLLVPRSGTAGGTDAGGDTVIAPGQQALMVARWVNLCPQAAQSASFNLRVFLSADPNDSFTVIASAPPCLGDTQPSHLTAQPFALRGDGVQKVRDYFTAINYRQYDKAYALFGAAMRQQNPSQDDFASGFRLTVSDDLHVIAASANDNQTVVAIQLIAHQRDGARWNFHGTYTIGPEDGALKILAANIVQD